MPVISERCDHYNIQSRGVETLRDLAVRVRRLTAWWIEALILWSLSNDVSVNSDSSGPCPWWRHQMETFSALLALCAGNSLVPGEFPAQRPVTRNFDVSFDLSLNKRLSEQSWGWWSETPSSSLWRHSNALIDIDLSGDGSCKCTVMQRRRLGVNRDWGGGLVLGESCKHDDVMTWWKRFPLHQPLCGEPPVTDGFPSQMASNADIWCFFRCPTEQSLEQTARLPVV